MRTLVGFRWLLAATLLIGLFAPELRAQTEPARISGEVRDQNGSPMAGVQIVIMNQQTGFQSGALTQANGRYLVLGLRPGGPYRIEARMIGYGLEALDDVVLEAGGTFEADFAMGTQAIALDALEVFATRAIERKTPVAYTDVPKVQIQNQLGSRDLPMVLNVTPSVYATQQGGGPGDARINVRGFSQRNTAVMLNGVPVNDMENGWVYWSNWDGVGDAATSIQLQRGLSAVNLAAPSIGGTLNIITDPSSVAPGFSWKQEFGSGHFLKETLVFNTGELANRFAFTGSLVRKTGEGNYWGGLGGDADWTDAWAYYFAGAFQINPTNRLELYAVGAPQRHGQNSYKLNIGTLSTALAKSLHDYEAGALLEFPKAGRTWSPNVNRVTVDYDGKQFTSTGPFSGTFSRHSNDFINERENYFHKPQVNLNWYSYFGNGLTLSTVGYYSGGAGGGTGTYGSLLYDTRYTQRFYDWDGTIERNRAQSSGASRGILRNSVNNQWTIGAISKLRKDFQGGITAEVGIDWRTAEMEHYREVRDLLGGDYYNDCYEGCSSDFWSAADGDRVLGDRINYDNLNTVDWFGSYVQAEKSSMAGSIYGMFGWALNSYTFKDLFKDDGTGKPLYLESGWISGYQIKGGASRNLTDEFSVFGNAGYVSKVPIFDAVIDDNNGVKNPDPKNERFTSFEAGLSYRSLDRSLSADLSLYHTTWMDRTRVTYVPDLISQDLGGLVNILGLDARHMGIEAAAAFQPADYVRLDAAFSLGSWKYLDNVVGQYKVEDQSAPTVTDTLYIKNLKVADAPQGQVAYAVSLFPVQDMYFRAQGRTYWMHYAEFDPVGRTDPSDEGKQSWELPVSTVIDLHASYRLGDVVSLWRGGDVRVFANVYNLLNLVYVSDALDNSRYNGYDGDHDADDAEVFLGLPRTFNLGFEVKF
ncbi:TonB-dependent receptor [Gemmatimonadota bacterium]